MSNTGINSSARYRPGIHLFACFCTLYTFFVVVVGGAVKSREAGLSIPEGFIFHWVESWWKIPNFREEYFHRMLVGGLGILVFILSGIVYKTDPRPRVKNLALALPVIILIQAFFGYLTVTLFAHWPTSIPHAALGQIFLCMVASMAAVTSRAWMSSERPVVSDSQPELRKLAKYNVIALFVQLLLGAALRHDDQARLLREGHHATFIYHLAAHFLGALTVVYFQARLISRILNEHREQKQLKRPVMAIMMLLTFQLMLGFGAAVLKVMYSEDIYQVNDPPAIRVVVATSHVAVGAAMLALAVVLWLRAHRYVVPRQAAAAAFPAEGNALGVSA